MYKFDSVDQFEYKVIRIHLTTKFDMHAHAFLTHDIVQHNIK